MPRTVAANDSGGDTAQLPHYYRMLPTGTSW
jgi:hypothetical protein